MQPTFPAARNDATVAAVEREILRAKRGGMPIVFLEIPYFSPLDEEGLPPTLKSLMALVKDYKPHQVMQKRYSDGSRQVNHICEEKGWTRRRFRVVGVNTDSCVLETVLGLADV